ncbi:MAG: fumarate hydratase [Candidatus Riflebacteria bacterium]|nr:fumarate hydratase [Candidatus Riflebacteria bacterium]
MNPIFRLITRDGIVQTKYGNREFLEIEPQVLHKLSAHAFHDAAFFLRTSQLESWMNILKDKDSSDKEKFVIACLIKNAVISAEGVLPLCQDTGTATIIAKRGEQVITGGEDERFLLSGIEETYRRENLRYSQVIASGMFGEKNSGNNLPAQIDIGFVPGNEYNFLFVAKGGGSSNKTFLSQESKALLNPASFESFLRERIKNLGVAACPPYHVAVIVGGTSPEQNLKMLKLATAGALDDLPISGSNGCAFRDPEWEKKVMQISTEQGFGAQFGGKWLSLSARVIRLSRHAASCPVSVGVSCSAHRNLLGKITKDGAFLEQLEFSPGRFLPELSKTGNLQAISIDLNQPVDAVKKMLSSQPIGAMVMLSGPLIVARDLAHVKLLELVKAGKALPDYFKNHPIYYAGPAKTPPNMVIGSMGPTTAERMDSYLETFMAHGASHITLAKGNRASSVAESCKKYGGFYLGIIGGSAALLAKENITDCSVIDFPELGMEAVHRIIVRDLPAFIIVNSQGNEFYR